MTNSSRQINSILLVDDDADELDLFQDALVKVKDSISLFYVQKCNMKKLRTIPKPDLIFLDINMPEYDGFDWLKSIREKVAEPIPVIMYSTSRNPEKISLAQEFGANLFITKPQSQEALVKTLDKVLQFDWSNPEQVTKECMESNRFHVAY